MKRIQIVPRKGFNLYGAMVQKEIDLYKGKRGTFFRSAPKQKQKARWAHKKFPGWIKLQRGTGGVVIAEVHSRSNPSNEWTLFRAFMGFIDRHYRDNIFSISIQYLDLGK